MSVLEELRERDDRLPYDIARCAAHFGREPCPLRDGCLRYLNLLADKEDENAGKVFTINHAVYANSLGCEMKIERRGR